MSIEGLNKGTGYQIRVVSKDGQGEETPAEWQEIVTEGVGEWMALSAFSLI